MDQCTFSFYHLCTGNSDIVLVTSHVEIPPNDITPQPVLFQLLEDRVANEVDETFSLILIPTSLSSEAAIADQNYYRLDGTIQDSDGNFYTSSPSSIIYLPLYSTSLYLERYLFFPYSY